MNETVSQVTMTQCFVMRARIPAEAPAGAGLIAWRMKRVREYIDWSFAQPITLSDLATVAGLSKMYFAAQFRRATGFRPHEFALRRRIERSQELLLGSELPLVQVALDVGFETQSHYSATFKRLVGETPARWRTLRRKQQDFSIRPARSSLWSDGEASAS